MSNSKPVTNIPVVGTFTLHTHHLQFSVAKSRADCMVCLYQVSAKQELNTYPANDEVTRFHLAKHFWLNTELELYGHLQEVATDRTDVVIISRIPGTTLVIWAVYLLMICTTPIIFPTFFAHFTSSLGASFLLPLGIWALFVGGNIVQVLSTRAALLNALIDALQGK